MGVNSLPSNAQSGALQVEFDTTRTYGNVITPDIHVYTLDASASWHSSDLPSSTIGKISSLHVDSTGKFVTIAVTGDQIYTSFNYGVNFIVNSGSSSSSDDVNRRLQETISWNQLAGSADGRHLIASTTDSSVFGGTRYNVEFAPSHTPTQWPSSRPSLRPTSNPTGVPPCGPGFTYKFIATAPGYECTACSAGTYTEQTAFECQSCPAGYRTNAALGASSCDACPINFYSTAANSIACTSCAAGLTNAGTGNTLKSSCVNPQMNFIIAFICLGVCMLGIAVYIVGGRLHRMSFVRKEFLVSKTSEMYTEVLARLRVMTALCQRAAEKKRIENLERGTPVWKQVMYKVMFFVIICLIFLLFFFAAILRVFFTSLILWRGYSFTIDVPFISRISGFISSLSDYVQIPYIDDMFYPFFYVVDYIASFNISLDSVNVTCLGSQIPMTLLVDCFVVGIVVIVIESDMEVFWSTTFGNVHKEFRSLTLQKQFWKKESFWSNIMFVLWSVFLQLCPHPRKILQYGLGFVRVMLFFNTNGHAASSANCDSAIPVGSSGLDTILAMCSTIIAYLLIFPLVYLLSQILVPDFRLQKGSVRTELKIRKKLLRKAHLICACEKCGLGLQRIHTNQFGGGCHCDWHDHKETEPNSPFKLKTEFQVVYACSAVKQCKWAICPTCYDKIHDSGNFSPRGPLSPVPRLPSTPKSTSPRSPMESDSLIRNSSLSSSNGRPAYRTAKSKTFTYETVEVHGIDLEATSKKDDDIPALHHSSTVEFDESQTCGAKMWNGFIYTLKTIMMIASLDWFYIKFTFVFAHRMFDALVPHLTRMNDKQSESDKSAKKPNLPWFYAVRDKHNDLKAEKEMIEEKWCEIASCFPSYYRMVLTVQDDVKPKIEHVDVQCSGCGVKDIIGNRYFSPEDVNYNLCETCEHGSKKTSKSPKTRMYREKHNLVFKLKKFASLCASWSILGQLCSERGRMIWWRVLHNYYIFALVSFGIWTEEAVRDYEIEYQFERQEAETRKVDEIVTARLKETEDRPFTRGELQRGASNTGDIFDTTDECDDRLQLISALVSTRVVLIQLIPYMTIYSTLAVDISSSPIFIFSPFLKEKVSELFASNLDVKAKEELKSMGAIEAQWKLDLLKYYIFCQHSRAITFLQNVVSNFIAISLVFANGDVLQGIMNFSMLWFLLQSIVLIIHPFILLHKLMFGENNKDKKNKLKQKSLELSSRSHIVSSDNYQDCESGGLEEPEFAPQSQSVVPDDTHTEDVEMELVPSMQDKDEGSQAEDVVLAINPQLSESDEEEDERVVTGYQAVKTIDDTLQQTENEILTNLHQNESDDCELTASGYQAVKTVDDSEQDDQRVDSEQSATEENEQLTLSNPNDTGF